MPSSQSNSSLQMREIISPFRNRATQEEGEWVINPERVKRYLVGSIADSDLPKQHLGSYIFNDSPENTYESETSKGSAINEENQPFSKVKNPHVLNLSQRKRDILNNSPSKNSNVNLTIIEQLKQRRLKQLEEQRQDGRDECRREVSPMEQMISRLMQK